MLGNLITLVLVLPILAVFTAINIALGCYIAIRLGYGPPNWQTSLNLIVRLTTLQRCLNAGRDWLEEKYPKVGTYLNRLPIPRPIVIVDTSPYEEEIEVEEDEQEPEENSDGQEEAEGQTDTQDTDIDNEEEQAT